MVVEILYLIINSREHQILAKPVASKSLNEKEASKLGF